MKSTYGCDSGAGKVPVIDSLRRIIYDALGNPIDTVVERPKWHTTFCYEYDWYWKKYFIDTNPDYWSYIVCWIPAYEITARFGDCKGHCDVTWEHKWYYGRDCKKDTTVYLSCFDPIKQIMRQDTLVLQVPDLTGPCVDSVDIVRTWIEVYLRTDTLRYINWVDVPLTYDITITDSCGGCPDPTIKLPGEEPRGICDIEILNVCPFGTQPQWDGNRLLLNYSCGVNINGRWGVEFYNLVETQALIAYQLKTQERMDSLRECCEEGKDSLAKHREEIDSLRNEIENLKTNVVVGTATIGGDGTVSVTWPPCWSDGSSHVLVSYAGNGSAGTAPPDATSDGGSNIIIRGDIGATVTYIIYCDP